MPIQPSPIIPRALNILPVAGKEGQFIYLGDRWTPENAIDGRYIWLPLEFEDGRFIIRWKDEWKLED